MNIIAEHEQNLNQKTPQNTGPLPDILDDPDLVDPDAPSPDGINSIKLGEDLQRQIVANILNEPSLCEFAAANLDPRAFTHKAHVVALQVSFEHWRKYRELMPKTLLEPVFAEKVKERKDAIAMRGELRACLEYVALVSPAYFRDKIIELAQMQVVGRATQKLMENGDLKAYYDLIAEARAIAPDSGEETLYSDDELEDLEDLQWQITDHFPKNGTITVFGSSGVGKSFLCLDMANSIAAGIPFLGRWATIQGRVLYVCSEGSYGLKGRVWAWKAAKKIARVPGIVYSKTCHDFQERAEVERLVENAVRRLGGLDLLIIDTLSRNFGAGDADKNCDMQAYLHNLDAVRETHGCTVVNLHHTGWSDTSRERGAKALRDYCDTSICVAKVGVDHIAVECKKQKDAREFEPYVVRKNVVPVREGTDDTTLWLSLDGSKAELATAQREAEKGEDEQKLVDMVPLTDRPEEGITIGKLVEALGWRRQKVNDLCVGLCDRNAVQRHRAGDARQPWLYYRTLLLN